MKSACICKNVHLDQLIMIRVLHHENVISYLNVRTVVLVWFIKSKFSGANFEIGNVCYCCFSCCLLYCDGEYSFEIYLLFCLYIRYLSYWWTVFVFPDWTFLNSRSGRIEYIPLTGSIVFMGVDN